MLSFLKKKDGPLDNVTREEFSLYSENLFKRVDGIQKTINQILSVKNTEQRAKVEASIEAQHIQTQNQEQINDVEDPDGRPGTPERDQQQGGLIRQLVASIGAAVAGGVGGFFGHDILEALGLAEDDEESHRRSSTNVPIPPPIPSLPKENKNSITRPSSTNNGVPSRGATPNSPVRRPNVVQRTWNGIRRGIGGLLGHHEPNASGNVTQGRNLASIIARGESGSAGYNAFNRRNGGSYGAHSGDLTSMTIGQIRAAQSSGEMFAVGKYQVIPSTLAAAQRELGLSDDIRFDASTQDRIYSEYLIQSKRPGIAAYLSGRSDDVQRAAQEVAMEWAAAATPAGSLTSHGRLSDGSLSYYDGVAGNRASISADEIIEALRRDRAGGVESRSMSGSGVPLAAASNRIGEDSFSAVSVQRLSANIPEAGRTMLSDRREPPRDQVQLALQPRNQHLDRAAIFNLFSRQTDGIGE